ncbi:MAG: 3-isopropylmalate dehydratase small subunit [Candidatus Carbobacillus altaicus]|nr:3-isopropylmalate dehydratase small subunit [Candidatus Carbobacillus altaicus]
MQPFTVHKGRVVPLDRSNVDTDQIIPKQFLKRIEKSGFGQFLFYEWRYHRDGQLNTECILNDPQYKGATILLTRENFGSGSSREHAAWALVDWGFRAVVAPSFADIFYTNAVNNGLLPVVMQDEVVDAWLKQAQKEALMMTIDLRKQIVQVEDGIQFSFEINPVHRERLLEGLDDIAITERYVNEIEAYEKARPLVALYNEWV